MTTEHGRNEYRTRDAILKLLSDDEIARVSMREAGSKLHIGDEFIDLEKLDAGVQTMQATTTVSPKDVLPRKSVHAETWTKVCARVNPVRAHQ